MTPHPACARSLGSTPPSVANEMLAGSTRLDSASVSGVGSTSRPSKALMASSVSPMSGNPVSARMPNGIGASSSAMSAILLAGGRCEGGRPDQMCDFGAGDIAMGTTHAVHVSDELRAVHVIDLAGFDLVGIGRAQHLELAARTVRHTLQAERTDRAELGQCVGEIDRPLDPRGQRIKNPDRVVVFRLRGDDGPAHLLVGQDAVEIPLPRAVKRNA